MALEHILPPPLPPLLSFPLLLGSSIAPPSWSKDDCFDRTRLKKTVRLIGRQGRQGTHERHGRHSRQWTRVITDQGEKSFVEELYTSTFHLVFPRPAFPKESIRGLGWREAPSCRRSGFLPSPDLNSYWKGEWEYSKKGSINLDVSFCRPMIAVLSLLSLSSPRSSQLSRLPLRLPSSLPLLLFDMLIKP